ncbi:MAG: hypothetical protein WAU62_05360 [Dehalococcoidales bacterium]
MTNNNGKSYQQTTDTKNWCIHHKMATGAIAMIAVLFVFIILIRVSRGFNGLFFELYIPLFLIYFIVFGIRGRKTVVKYFNIVWARLEYWEGSNPSSPTPKTKKEWFRAHKVTTSGTAFLIFLVIIFFGIPPLQNQEFMGIIFELYVIVFLIYIITWVIKWRKSLLKNLACFGQNQNQKRIHK